MALTSELKVYGYTKATTALNTVYAKTAITTNLRPRNDDYLVAELDTLWIKLTAVSGAGAAKVKLTLDADGDIPISPESVEEDIVVGEATATVGTVVFRGDFTISGHQSPIIVDSNGRAVVYLWVALDAGTATLGEVVITTRP